MRRYNRLLPQAGYLSNVTLKLSPANGVRRRDLREAEALAAAAIDAELSGLFYTGAWQEETPGLIQRIADMLSSAEVLRRKYSRGRVCRRDEAHLPEVLERDARSLLGMIKRGALVLFARSGRIQERLARENPARAEPARAAAAVAP